VSPRQATARNPPARSAASRARASTAARTRRAAGVAASRRGAVRRRRIGAVLHVAMLAAVGTMLVRPVFEDAVKQVTLPLRHEDIIRQQASDKGLDPALIAAVIYTESHFRDQTSPAGAKGLMQITPGTAKDIARKSGGTAFQLGDLSTPQVNISYGAFYLRYLMDRYGGNETLALAAYNGGEGNVDHWVDAAAQKERTLRPSDIPFPETRAYVVKVERTQHEYRSRYARELGVNG
jgi:soluble lytic murein transglycosylase